MDFNEMISIDLLSLQSITLGNKALCGRDDNDSCSLIMRSNNEMIRKIYFVDLPILKSINSKGNCFNNARLVTLESILNY